jgi:hypothetical protein
MNKTRYLATIQKNATLGTGTSRHAYPYTSVAPLLPSILAFAQASWALIPAHTGSRRGSWITRGGASYYRFRFPPFSKHGLDTMSLTNLVAHGPHYQQLKTHPHALLRSLSPLAKANIRTGFSHFHQSHPLPPPVLSQQYHKRRSTMARIPPLVFQQARIRLAVSSPPRRMRHSPLAVQDTPALHPCGSSPMVNNDTHTDFSRSYPHNPSPALALSA